MTQRKINLFLRELKRKKEILNKFKFNFRNKKKTILNNFVIMSINAILRKDNTDIYTLMEEL